MSSLTVGPDLKMHLEAIATTVSKPKGSVLFRRGDEGAGVFLIQQGQVRLVLDGTECVYPSRDLGSGSVLGLPATLSGEKYSLTAEVTADSRFAFVARQAVLNLLSRNSDLSLQVMHLLSGEISSMRETMAAHL